MSSVFGCFLLTRFPLPPPHNYFWAPGQGKKGKNKGRKKKRENSGKRNVRVKESPWRWQARFNAKAGIKTRETDGKKRRTNGTISRRRPYAGHIALLPSILGPPPVSALVAHPFVVSSYSPSIYLSIPSLSLALVTAFAVIGAACVDRQPPFRDLGMWGSDHVA